MPREIRVELGDVAGELLAERERHGVHQVRSADLDDVRERLRLRVERVAQVPHRGDEARRWISFGGGDVHRGRERVVRRLGHVHVVVRVDRLLRAHLPPASSIARLAITSLAFMLVWVPLPVCQTRSGKCASRVAGDDFVGRAGRSASAFVGRQLAELAVDQRRGLLQDAERADDRPRHPSRADREVDAASAGSGRPSSGRPGPRSGPCCRTRSAPRIFVLSPLRPCRLRREDCIRGPAELLRRMNHAETPSSGGLAPLDCRLLPPGEGRERRPGRPGSPVIARPQAKAISRTRPGDRFAALATT